MVRPVKPDPLPEWADTQAMIAHNWAMLDYHSDLADYHYERALKLLLFSALMFCLWMMVLWLT